MEINTILQSEKNRIQNQVNSILDKQENSKKELFSLLTKYKNPLDGKGDISGIESDIKQQIRSNIQSGSDYVSLFSSGFDGSLGQISTIFSGVKLAASLVKGLFNLFKKDKFSKVYLLNDIPNDKLNKAITTQKISKSEEFILLIDNTKAGTENDFVIFTYNGIYYRYSDKQLSVKWNEIKNLHVKGYEEGVCIHFGKFWARLDTFFTGNVEILKSIIHLISFLIVSKEKINELYSNYEKSKNKLNDFAILEKNINSTDNMDIVRIIDQTYPLTDFDNCIYTNLDENAILNITKIQEYKISKYSQTDNFSNFKCDAGKYEITIPFQLTLPYFVTKLINSISLTNYMIDLENNNHLIEYKLTSINNSLNTNISQNYVSKRAFERTKSVDNILKWSEYVNKCKTTLQLIDKI